MLARTRPRAQHSSADPCCQSGPRPVERNAAPRCSPRIRARYGDAALRAGFTVIPNTLLAVQARLGLEAFDLVLVLQICSFWWDDHLPYPSVAHLAARMGCGERRVQYRLRYLEARGFLQVVRRSGPEGQLTNGYDPRPLLRAAAALAEGDRGAPPPSRKTVLRRGRAAAIPTPAVPRPGAQPGEQRASAPAAPAQPAAAEPAVLQSRPGPPDGAPHLRQRDPAHEAVHGAGVHCSAPPPVHDRAPEEDEDVQDEDLALVSFPLPPADAPSAPGREHGGTGSQEPPLEALIVDLGRRFPDAAPRASAGRVRRLLAHYPAPAGTAAALLEAAAAETARRGVGGGMAYVLAVFEALLRDRVEGRRPPGRLLRPHPRPQRTPEQPARERAAAPEHAPPLWRALLEQLRGTLADAALARLTPLAVAQEEGVLRLQASSHFERQWVERVLRRRLEEGLRDLGLEVRLEIGEAA